MNGNLPDNVSEGDPRAPWNQPDNVWDIGVLERADFECNHCGFSMTGDELATLEWDDRDVTEAGNPVHACPACVTDAVQQNSFGHEDITIGLLLMPHICGVTDIHCQCAEEERADEQLEQEREGSYV